jgi:hypothetical protein
MLKDWELGVGRDLTKANANCEESLASKWQKPFDPKKTTPGNCEPGIDRDLVSDGEKLGTQPVIGPLDILERFLLSLPEEKVFTNARWVCRQPCHNNAKQIGSYHWNPMKRISFVVCPWNALSSSPRPSPSSVEIRSFLKRFLHLCVVFAVILAVRLFVVSPRVCRVAHCCFLKKIVET